MLKTLSVTLNVNSGESIYPITSQYDIPSGYTSTSGGYLGTIYSKSIDLSKYDTIEVVACSLSGGPLYLALCTSNSAYSSIYSLSSNIQ